MKEQRERILWRLRVHNLTQTWLINMLEEVSEISVCKTNLSDILRGVRRNDTADKVVLAADSILDEYERWKQSITAVR